MELNIFIADVAVWHTHWDDEEGSALKLVPESNICIH